MDKNCLGEELMFKDRNLKTPPNRWVGGKIGYSESGASLLRRGLRQPTIPLMQKVSQALSWTIEDQVSSTNTHMGWTKEFERRMCEAYTDEIENRNTTTNEGE